MEAPCYCCEKRTLGCHAKCAKYQEFREWLDEAKKNEIHRERKYIIYG